MAATKSPRLSSSTGQRPILDAPFETILDLWYASLGEAVVTFTLERLGNEIKDDWLMDNIRRIVLCLDGGEDWLASHRRTPYVMFWGYNQTNNITTVRLIYQEKAWK